jgi:excisionase family DNA binding protein
MSDTAERLTITEAARRLGLTDDGVRKRIKRGKLQAIRDEDGRIYVVMPSSDADTDPSETVSEGSETNSDNGPDSAILREIIDRQDAEIRFLRAELEDRTEELRRKDHIIAGLVQRIPELPSGAPESPVSRESPRDESQDLGGVYRVPEAVQRPWWAFWRRP